MIKLTCVPFRKLRHISASYFNQSDRFPNHEQILQLETAAVLTCKCLQYLQNNITRVLGRNISLPNKFPLVLPFKGFPLMTKLVMNSFFYIKLYTLSFRGVTTVIIQRTLNDWIIQCEYVPCTMAIRHQNGKAKWNMSLQYTCVKKLLKMACCWRNIVVCMHPR